MIQPGTSLEEKWDPSQSEEIADRVWSMTAEAAVRGADLVLWPEGAMPYRIDDDPAYREVVTRMAGEFDIEIVLNSIGFARRRGLRQLGLPRDPARACRRCATTRSTWCRLASLFRGGPALPSPIRWCARSGPSPRVGNRWSCRRGAVGGRDLLRGRFPGSRGGARSAPGRRY